MLDPFDLNFRHLRAVPMVLRRGSVNGAAETAHLSQPALTQGLAKLERLLRVSLFERRADGMVATAAGALVAGRIEAALDHLATATRGRRAGRGFTRPDLLMTATQARAFLALADAGSFVDAARSTGLSQPAVHRAVRDLEQLGGVPLVERRGRGVVLSDDGRRLARGVRLMAVELRAAILELQPDAAANGRLVIGAMPLSRARLLPRAIAALVAAAPGAAVDVVEGSWRELVEPLRDGSLDLMVGALRPSDVAGLAQEALFEDRLVVVAGSHHPLTRERAPTVEQLARYPWIVGLPNTPLRLQWEAMFLGHAPPAPVACGSVMVIRGVLAESDCLTLLSPHQIAMEVEAGVLVHIGQPRAALVRTIGVTTRQGWHPTALQQRFLALLRSGEDTTQGIE